jgi:hypothetical protein
VEEAAALFNQVIAAHPDHANAQYPMGKILVDRGELNDGRRAFRDRYAPEPPERPHALSIAGRLPEGIAADADRELEICKALKAKHRERDRAAIPPVQSP